MNKSQPIVYIVDDDEAIQQSLSMLVESVGLKARTYSSADEFLGDYDPQQPGCLLLDIRMPGMSGLELQSRLKEKGMTIPVIIITGHADVPVAVRSIKAGALEFIEKPFRDQILLDNIQKAIAIDAERRKGQAHRRKVEQKLASLTPREEQIMNQLILGKSNKAIGYELGISQKTVDFHRVNAMRKMGVQSVVELLRLMHKVGLC